MTEWQAIVFDLDDTLYPERDYVLSGFRAVSEWADAHLGIPAQKGYAELEQLFERGIRGDTFGCWLASRNLSTEMIVPQLVQIYRLHEPKLKLFPEAEALLASLGRRYRLGLVSDGYLNVQQRKLNALGVERYFDAIVFSDELGRENWKPSARPFEAIIERLAVDASRSVYIADNPAKDFYGARRVGLFTVRLRRRGGEYAQLEPQTPQYAPHVTVESFAELEQLLAERVGAR